MARIRFKLRSIFIAIGCICIILGFIHSWWTKPYAMTGAHQNGFRAWEIWERRTANLKIEHVKTIRYYQNGQIGMIYANGTTRYWSPDGNSTTEEEYFNYLWKDGLANITDDQHKRPYQDFIWWWNGW